MTGDWIADGAGIATALFMLLTVIVARAQLRALNKSTQLQNFIELTKEFDSPEFCRAHIFVIGLRQLDAAERQRALDEDAAGGDPRLDRVLNFFERIAFLSDRGYLDRDLVIRWFGAVAGEVYSSVRELLELRARAGDPGAGSDFKKLVEDAHALWDKESRPQRQRERRVPSRSLRIRRRIS